MELKYILNVKFIGETYELNKIKVMLEKYIRDYEDRDIEVIRELALECGIEKDQAVFFIAQEHPARLDSVYLLKNELFVLFAAHPWAVCLLKLMMLNIKGSCKCTWLSFGNHYHSASFYNEDEQSFTQELLTAKQYQIIDEDSEDLSLYNEEDDLLFELDDLDEALEYWCDYNDVDPDAYTQEQLLELISDPDSDYSPVVNVFKKDTKIQTFAHKTVAKIVFKGDEDTILGLYDAARSAIDDYSGDFFKFCEDYNEDDDFNTNCKLLDATFTENDGFDSELEITAFSYFDQENNAGFKVDGDILDDFIELKNLVSDANDTEILADVYLVSDCDFTTLCEIESDNEFQVGYLSVNAKDEFGKDASFLMCDHLDKLIARWCELVHYDGDIKDSTKMLDVINKYSYQNENTKIQAGLISTQN